MVEYRTSAHAVFDIKYHFVWITKYRYKILRRRIAERARDLLRQICQVRGAVIIRGAVAATSICWYRRRRTWHRPNWCSSSKAVRRDGCKTNSPNCGNAIGDSTCGREATFARVWARWTRIRSRNTSKIKNGQKRIKDSRSPRPPSLESALSRDPFRRLQPQPRLSVGT